MATLKELSLASGVQEIAPGRTVGEQRDEGMYASGELQYDDVAPADYGFTGQIQDGSKFQDPFYSNLQKITQPVGSFLNKYSAPVVGGIMSLASGIPGLGYILNSLQKDPYAQNRIGMYGVGKNSAGFDVDKFGYNVGTTLMKNNFLQPGSNSFRSYALEGLGSLDPVAANNYYQNTYGLNFDDVKSAIQQKEDPFGSAGIIDMGSDYQGGGDNENNSFNDSRGEGGGSFGDATNDAGFSDYS